MTLDTLNFLTVYSSIRRGENADYASGSDRINNAETFVSELRRSNPAGANAIALDLLDHALTASDHAGLRPDAIRAVAAELATSSAHALQLAYDKLVQAEVLVQAASGILAGRNLGTSSHKLSKRASRIWTELGALRFRIQQLGAPHVK